MQEFSLLGIFSQLSLLKDPSPAARGDANTNKKIGAQVNLAPIFLFVFAEREGFEPPVQLPVHRISSAAHSTTLASFQKRCKGR